MSKRVDRGRQPRRTRRTRQTCQTCQTSPTCPTWQMTILYNFSLGFHYSDQRSKIGCTSEKLK